MKDIRSNLKRSDTWKIQLAIAINFVSSKGTDKECEMHSRSDKIEITIYGKAKEVIQSLFESLFNRYQIGLKP